MTALETEEVMIMSVDDDVRSLPQSSSDILPSSMSANSQAALRDRRQRIANIRACRRLLQRSPSATTTTSTATPNPSSSTGAATSSSSSSSKSSSFHRPWAMGADHKESAPGFRPFAGVITPPDSPIREKEPATAWATHHHPSSPTASSPSSSSYRSAPHTTAFSSSLAHRATTHHQPQPQPEDLMMLYPPSSTAATFSKGGGGAASQPVKTPTRPIHHQHHPFSNGNGSKSPTRHGVTSFRNQNIFTSTSHKPPLVLGTTTTTTTTTTTASHQYHPYHNGNSNSSSTTPGLPMSPVRSWDEGERPKVRTVRRHHRHASTPVVVTTTSGTTPVMNADSNTHHSSSGISTTPVTPAVTQQTHRTLAWSHQRSPSSRTLGSAKAWSDRSVSSEAALPSASSSLAAVASGMGGTSTAASGAEGEVPRNNNEWWAPTSSAPSPAAAHACERSVVSDSPYHHFIIPDKNDDITEIPADHDVDEDDVDNDPGDHQQPLESSGQPHSPGAAEVSSSRSFPHDLAANGTTNNHSRTNGHYHQQQQDQPNRSLKKAWSTGHSGLVSSSASANGFFTIKKTAGNAPSGSNNAPAHHQNQVYGHRPPALPIIEVGVRHPPASQQPLHGNQHLMIVPGGNAMVHGPQGNGMLLDDDVSSLGGIEDQSPSLMRMTWAIRNHSLRRPSSLTPDERILWDTVQQALFQARLEGTNHTAASSSVGSSSANSAPGLATTGSFGADMNGATALLLPNSPSREIRSVGSGETWESKYMEIQERAKEQQEENDKSFRAIQRVLADVTAERDRLAKQFRKLQKEQQDNDLATAIPSVHSFPLPLPAPLASPTVSGSSFPPIGLSASFPTKIQDHDSNSVQGRGASMPDSANDSSMSAQARIASLERELQELKDRHSADESSTELLRREVESLSVENANLHGEKQALMAELEAKKAQQAAGGPTEGRSRPTTPTSMASRERSDSMDSVDKLRKDVQEKSGALESAKMIIASLEKANASVAADMRAKLKVRDDEIARLKIEMAGKQKMLDRLGSELRELQRVQAAARVVQPPPGLAEERARRLALTSRLEQNMADIRAASVIVESTHDPETMDRISDLLSESVEALKATIDEIEDYDDSHTEVDSIGSGSMSTSSRSRRINVDVTKLTKEMEEKNAALRRLEEELRQAKTKRTEIEELANQRNEELNTLKETVIALRNQCSTNMEVLTRKERELSVLRDSLKVDEGDAGYISDDASENDEADPQPLPRVVEGKYGPSQAEALATLLAHGGGGGVTVNSTSGSPTEVDRLKSDLFQARSECDRARKDLKTEKESLANAKMIISSLEKANKSMMEDLRSRLQDSNSAIASLLEKSMGSEQTAAKLKAELEQLKKERDEDRERYQKELETWRYGGGATGGPHHAPALITPRDEKKEDFFPTETID